MWCHRKALGSRTLSTIILKQRGPTRSRSNTKVAEGSKDTEVEILWSCLASVFSRNCHNACKSTQVESVGKVSKDCSG